MHLYYLVGLTFFVSIAWIDADTSMTDSKVTQPNHVVDHLSIANGISVARLLRTRIPSRNVPNEEDTEERVEPSISALEKVKAMFTSSKVAPKKLASWLEKEKSLETVFVRLRLHQDGTWLFYNPRLATWVQYADDLSIKRSSLLFVYRFCLGFSCAVQNDRNGQEGT
ncbi:Putative RxLR effector [Phytophthora palmivora]|uniref:RxLR effector protein n=1 Tax=Phytophthora palmivora TaxID=4796 RepID=A0A2P4YBE6_9STRA|nr:Putative RxLR effector [Phytophthora palmivora]